MTPKESIASLTTPGDAARFSFVGPCMPQVPHPALAVAVYRRCPGQEPLKGLEPSTTCLQGRCSTIELKRQIKRAYSRLYSLAIPFIVLTLQDQPVLVAASRTTIPGRISLKLHQRFELWLPPYESGVLATNTKGAESRQWDSNP
jgi:hypothetical protein